jgi:UDP-4-amino-4,6-dideoxy-N-acetyl-beta-L-altrosamine transaminase
VIPYGHQSIEQADIDAVIEVLRSDFITQGPMVPKFERDLEAICNVGHAVAVNSATSALHLACLALGLGQGDWLWTSPNSFVASANCGLYCGARVDFVDIDPKSYNLCTTSLRQKLEHAEKDGRLPKVVIPVHFAGQSCDMKEIHSLAKRYGFKVIEDGSHSLGGTYLGENIGNCRYSDITVLSFHPVKIITTGEGGAALTNDSRLAATMAKLRSHGITRVPDEMVKGVSTEKWFYEQNSLGFNFRMTEISAALGISQLKRLGEFINKRKVIAKNYNQSLTDQPLVLPRQNKDADSAWHLYVVQLDSSKTKIDRTTFYRELTAAKIGVNVHYIPIHTQPYYQLLGFKEGDFPVAEKYYKNTITLPIYPLLTHKDQMYVIDTIGEILCA